jgi:hypothetical protein
MKIILTALALMITLSACTHTYTNGKTTQLYPRYDRVDRHDNRG